MARQDKHPKTAGAFLKGRKVPREAKEPVDDQCPAWRLGRIDFDGPWCPKSLGQDKLVEITRKLGQFESQSWSDLVRHGCHPVGTNDLIKKARDRLAVLKLDDIGQLYSVRLTGVNRIWGVKIRNVFIAIWWDPEHEICPAILKHT